jgi:dihydrofolate reductase
MSRQIITAVVAMNKDRIIGADNQLPWHIPEDLQYFIQVTLNKPIIMGRKTFESIGRALPSRRNIVISRSRFEFTGIEVYSSIEIAISQLANEAEICIIGGGEIFKQTAHLINSLHITEVDLVVDNPCAWFPLIDLNNWSTLLDKTVISLNGTKCRFKHYICYNK